MTRYYFDLTDGAGGARDDDGTDLPDDWAAIAYGHQIAHDLMRNDEPNRRRFCISVHGEAHVLLFTLPFVAVDETMSGLHPETRAIMEACYERRRGLSEAMHSARLTMQQARALVARSQRKPYLAAVDGQSVL